MQELEILTQLRSGEAVPLAEIATGLDDLLSRINIIEWQLGDTTRRADAERTEYQSWRARAIRARQIMLEEYRELKKHRAQITASIKGWNAREVIGMGSESDPDELLAHCRLMIVRWVKQGKVELNEEEGAILDLTTEYLTEEVGVA